jgi:putative selenate reductase
LRYNQLLETPIGVAAGPQTQLAQNIISAWLCGARYIELKTIQTLDELTISKPCIDMQDEGYNCEWSQELKIKESYEEYLKAWILIHLLKHKFNWDNSEGLGVIFNMSVGYNLEGILKDNVQWFFNKMSDCSYEKEQMIKSLSKFYPEIQKINIPNQISNNITLSTMHGCPPDEIEKIASYLICDKKLHTTVKLNPTLLGAKELRTILNEKLGFKTTVPDIAFEHDLKYPDAIKIIRNLQNDAQKTGVQFSIKLTNTLESVNHKNIFPPTKK